MVFSLIVDWVLLQFWTTRIPKLLKFCQKNRIFFGCSPFSIKLNNNAFLMPNLTPFWSQVDDQNPKNLTKMHIQDASIFCITFGIDFCAIWAPSWGGPWTHFSCDFRRWCAQFRLDPPLGAQIFLNYSPKEHFESPESILQWFSTHFFAMWAPFWRPFGSIFRVSKFAFLEHVDKLAQRRVLQSTSPIRRGRRLQRQHLNPPDHLGVSRACSKQGSKFFLQRSSRNARPPANRVLERRGDPPSAKNH